MMNKYTEYLKNLSYYKKNRGLLIMLLLMLLIAYFAAIRNTVNSYQRNQELRANFEKGKNAPPKINRLEKKLNKINSMLDKYLLDSLNNQEYVMGIISDFCKDHHLTLQKFEDARVHEQEDMLVYTNKLIAEGNFINLVKLVYFLEMENRAGRVTSVNFHISEDMRTRKELLYCNIYLQSLKMKNDAL